MRDHGPGFDEEDLPYVFDRFHRAKDARSKPGSGLGLAIVRQAAEAHGGFVEAANAPGGGAIVRVGFGPTLELGERAASALAERPVVIAAELDAELLELVAQPGLGQRRELELALA